MSIRCSLGERLLRTSGKLKTNCVPCCATFSSSMINGARGIGGSGSPIFPQPARKKRKQGDKETRRRRKIESFFILFSLSPCLLVFLQDVPTEVFILDDVSEHVLNVGRVNLLLLLFQVGAFEGDFVEHFFEDSV